MLRAPVPIVPSRNWMLFVTLYLLLAFVMLYRILLYELTFHPFCFMFFYFI